MKKLICLILFPALLPYPSRSQDPGVIQKDAMKVFAWMIGEWKGNGWAMTESGKPESFLVEETLTWALDSTLIEVKGRGISPEGETGHQARAVISYDFAEEKYRWHAWRIPGGIFVEYEPMLTDSGFVWGMDVPGGKLRYTVVHTAEDTWFEKGEFSRDGSQWFQILEMELSRK